VHPGHKLTGSEEEEKEKEGKEEEEKCVNQSIASVLTFYSDFEI
jgi:hypothetical protein